MVIRKFTRLIASKYRLADCESRVRDARMNLGEIIYDGVASL